MCEIFSFGEGFPSLPMATLLPASLEAPGLQGPQTSSASGRQQAGQATGPFSGAFCQYTSCHFSEDGSVFFFKSNETSWTICSCFPRSKGRHKGGSGKRAQKVASQHPRRGKC